MLISSGVAYDAATPTILQSIAFIYSLADGKQLFSSPSTSSFRRSARNNRTSSTSDSPEIFAFRDVYPTNQTPEHYDSLHVNENDSAQDSEFNLEDFNFQYVLGQGRSKVYYESKNQLAVKAIDLFKEQHLLAELKNEIEIYSELQQFQGKFIPQLVLHGNWDAAMFCLGFSFCGTVPTSLDNIQKKILLDAIDAIHSKGILHNDIRVENFLVDACGKPSLIDFGFATTDSDIEAQEAERNQLISCLNSL